METFRILWRTIKPTEQPKNIAEQIIRVNSISSLSIYLYVILLSSAFLITMSLHQTGHLSAESAYMVVSSAFSIGLPLAYIYLRFQFKEIDALKMLEDEYENQE